MATETWQVDSAHSEITFKVRHLIIAEIAGFVRRWHGTIAIDPEHLTRSAVQVVLDAGSMETGDPERDEHVCSKEFLNVKVFPEIRFNSRSVRQVEGNRTEIVGDLTIRHATREVTVEVEDLGRARDDKGAMRARFRAHATVNRQHFGLHWNQDLDAGGVPVPLAGDDHGAPTRQRAADRVIRLATHHHGVTHRGGLEMGQVLRQVPGHLATTPDHQIGAHSGKQRDRHTAIGALMAGCGS